MKECYKYYKMLSKEMDQWLKQSVRMDGPGPNGGGEDEANYALAWFPHYLITRSPKVKDRFEDLLNYLAGWVERECLHGYEPEAESLPGSAKKGLLAEAQAWGTNPVDASIASATARRYLRPRIVGGCSASWPRTARSR